MPPIKKAFDEARVPFTKMTFSPDVPSAALGPNEYNSGLNVETDIRGIRSVNGDAVILPAMAGTPTFISGGYRQPIPGVENDYWFLIATTEGSWYANNGEGTWLDVTPPNGPFTTYTQATNITEAWNGTVPFFNDEANPPMFWSEFDGVAFPIDTISGDGSTVTVTFDNQADEVTGVTIAGHKGEFTYTNGVALKVGQKITISGINDNTQNLRLPNIRASGLNGEMSCDNVLAPAYFTASIAGTIMTVTTVADGFILPGMTLDAVGIVEGTTILNQLTGVFGSTGTYTVSDSQTLASTDFLGQRSTGLLVGQTVIVQGTTSTTDQTLSTVKITSKNGDFSCASADLTSGQVVEISGTITNTPTVLSTVSIDSTTGDFSCAASTLYEGQYITVSGTMTNTPTVLSTVSCVGGTGQFECAATSLQVGQVVEVAGVASTSPIVLSGVAITGTAGEFSCAAASLYVGQIMEISGTFGGTGSITDYTNPTIYKISATNGSTTFTLVSLTDDAITTTAGTPTGLTYTIAPQSIANYTNPTSYVISATNGSTTFTLQNLNGSSLVTTGGSVDPLTFTVQVPEISGYTNPTNYIITATNGSNQFTLVDTTGAALTTKGGIPTGLTFTALTPAITGYTNPTEYFLYSTNGSTTFKLYNIVTDPETSLRMPGSPIETQGGLPTGLTFTVKAPSITGYTSPTNYYILETNGTSRFTLVDTDGNRLETTGGEFGTSIAFRVQHPSITGYTDPTTYYVISTNGRDNFQLSATNGGTPISTNAGVPTGLVYTFTPFAIGEDIIIRRTVPTAYRGTYTITDCGSDYVQYSDTATGTASVLGGISETMPRLTSYSNILPQNIYDIVYDDYNTMQIILSATLPTPPYVAGDEIVISGINSAFNGTFTVKSSTEDTITYYATPASNYPGSGGVVAPKYAWNYNPNWSSVYAKWMRLYNTPNVGCILVAGGLTATDLDGTVFEYPVTVQWSQAFGLNQAPLTWQPTVTNIANQLEVPLRGQALDAFPANGQMFICSYWDTVVLSPINYTTTSAPILGVRLVNQGRGILSSNCWTNTDKMVYGVDARDIWAFDGENFVGIGNQRVKNWFYNQIDQNYVDRIFMDSNTSKNQIEIYYPTKPPVISSIVIDDTTGTFSCNPLLNNGGVLRNGLAVYLTGTESGTGSISGYNPAGTMYWIIETNGVDTFQLSETPTGDAITTTAGTVIGVNFEFISDGVPNMMLSYRYDLDCWNAPREVQSATMTCEAPDWSSEVWYYNVPGTTLTGSGSGAHFNILRQSNAYDGYTTPNVRGSGYSVGDTILVTGDLVGGTTPANDVTITVTEVDTASDRIAEWTATGEPLDTWVYDSGRRHIVYARGLEGRPIVQKDTGYNMLGPQLRQYNINSRFTRDNIKMTPDYSNKYMVHRVLPEVNNLNKYNLPIDPVEEPKLISSVDITVSGSNSVGQSPQATVSQSISTDTDYPWVQFNQNAYRVNSFTISASSQDQIWQCSASTWQYTIVEDDR
jgi:hypothetical protein